MKRDVRESCGVLEGVKRNSKQRAVSLIVWKKVEE